MTRRTVFRPRIWAAALALLSAPEVVPQATARAQGTSGVVYVESNDPAGNAILAYRRQADGSLTPLNGSPFPTGGLGVTPSFNLGPFDSDQNIITDPSHTFLYAVNGGSDSIAVFTINADGSLTAVPGSPFPSGGSNPVSVGLSGDLLVVVNKDEDPDHPGLDLPNYTTFRVSARGKLTPVPKSTYTVDLGSDPTQAQVSPGGGLVFGADFLGGVLRSFQLPPTGRLVAADAQELPPSQFADTGAPPLPLGLAVHPRKPLLYVGCVTINRVAVYRYSPAGALRFLRTVPDSGNGVCWLTLNKAGTRLYASNTGDPGVSVFDTERDPSEPTEIQKIILKGTGGGYQFALDPTGGFLQVVTQQNAAGQDATSHALHVLSVGADGKVTEVPTSPTVLPVPNLVRPQGVVAL